MIFIEIVYLVYFERFGQSHAAVFDVKIDLERSEMNVLLLVVRFEEVIADWHRSDGESALLVRCNIANGLVFKR